MYFKRDNFSNKLIIFIFKVHANEHGYDNYIYQK